MKDNNAINGNNKPDGWTELKLTSSESMVDIIADFLVTETGSSIVTEELSDADRDGCPMVRLTACLNGKRRTQDASKIFKKLKAILPEEHASQLQLSCSVIHDDDWKEGWKKYFRPVKIGRHIVVKPSWETFMPDAEDIVIDIDPGQAFGVGTHASTALMLETLESLILKIPCIPDSVLDIGAGTGILAIAAARLGAENVVGTDIDTEAVHAARTNVLLNNVKERVSIISLPIDEIDDRFDLILANIDRDTLSLLSNDIANIASEDAVLVVSGILEGQAETVVSCYARHGFSKIRMINHTVDKEWVCVVFCRGTYMDILRPIFLST